MKTEQIRQEWKNVEIISLWAYKVKGDTESMAKNYLKEYSTTD